MDVDRILFISLKLLCAIMLLCLLGVVFVLWFVFLPNIDYSLIGIVFVSGSTVVAVLTSIICWLVLWHTE